MSQVVLGKDLVKNRKKFMGLPEDFFDLLDPDGFNVLWRAEQVNDVYECVGLFKVKGTQQPWETPIVIPIEVYTKIVYEINLSQLVGEQNVH